jgi:geranylgeranyl diphosphate synthase, type II
VAEKLQDFLNRARARVDAALDRYLPTPPACPRIVGEAMRYSVFAGGKRFRPVLALAAADAVAKRYGAARSDLAGERAETIELTLPAGCAIEMIHTYSLIHDDLPAMDDDTLRRGRPTLHVVYGDGIAILAGDGLHAEAFTLLAREPASDDPLLVARKLRVIGLVGEAAGAGGMVGGQAIDLQAAGQAPGHPITLDGDGLRGMHARKTGALIRAAAASGAIMAGGTDDVIDTLDRYAADLGLAFQIVDDVLDVEGDAGQLGKTTGKDAAGDKPTYPSIFGIERSRVLATECIERARQTIEGGGLADGWLWPIAEWILHRKH